MTEEIKVENPHGPLELLGGEYESALLLNGQPIQFTFVREIGTTWRYQIAQGISEADIIQDTRFQNFVRYGFVTADSLQHQFAYLINKLATGTYRLELGYVDSSQDLWEVNQDGYQHVDQYTYPEYIVATQAYQDERTVAEYVGLIEKGNEPIVVVLTAPGSDSPFLLDGHHKFRAYAKLKTPAQALTITKLNPTPIDRQLGLALFAKCGSCNAEYRNRFLEYK